MTKKEPWYIDSGYRPKVLLLGNGINNWSKYSSWTDMLVSLCDDPKIRDYLNSSNKQLPMSMQVILATNDDIAGAIKRYNEKNQEYKKTNPFFGKITSNKQVDALQDLLSAGFDCILTTNYSYELEYAAKEVESVTSANPIKQMSDTFADKVENKYLLRSFNKVVYQGVENKIFHIHGEARKPSGIILGHDYYSRLLGRIIVEADSRSNNYQKNQMNNKPQPIDSWIDLFLLGDVYVLGFGFDFAEIDLWWLLNRKKNEKAEHGNVYFYEIADESKTERNMMLKLMEVKIEDFNIRKDGKDTDYDLFYTTAIQAIVESVKRQ